jgi:catalase
MPEADMETTPYNPFDLTKVWPHEDYPLIDVGTLKLNRNPENYFAEVEQAAFSPANVVPGIGHSPDKVLQMRILSYGDAQRYRVGANHQALPVNAAKCPVHTYQRDGAMRFDGNDGGSVNYQPNSFAGPVEDPSVKEPPLPIGDAADRYDHRDGNDDFTQAGNLFRLMTEDERERLMDTIASAMDGIPADIVKRQIGYFRNADAAYGDGIAKRLGVG